MAEDLKPCPNPWCFSTSAPVPIGLTNGYGNRSGWAVQCGCGVKTHRANTRHAAISGWNTRRPPPDRPDLADLDRSAVSAERPGREAVIAAIEAKVAEVKAVRLEMGFDAMSAWRPLYNEEIADAILSLFPETAPVKADTAGEGWLIEEFSTSTQQLKARWWDGDAFTADSSAAIRFARREDAQKFIDNIGWTEGVPTEHRWG